MTAVDNSGREYTIYINLDDYALSIKPKTQNIVMFGYIVHQEKAIFVGLLDFISNYAMM